MNNQILLRCDTERMPVVETAIRLFSRIVRERCGSEVVETDDPHVVLDIASGIGAEGFRTEDADGAVRVVGNDERGLLYGVGKLLRNAHYGDGVFSAGDWRGTSVPEKSMRAMYFATHFFNFYHAAPVAEVTRYIEELALWGCNALFVWFDMHHYTGIDAPDAQAMIARLKAFLSAANGAGMGGGLTLLANEAYAGSPEELRADWRAGQNGYHREPGGHYHVELCPSIPAGLDKLLSWRREVFDAFADVDLEYISIWAYDQGGCTCSKCAPWGARGLLKCAPPVAALAKEAWPDTKVILSTWYFDLFTSGEFSGLRAAFAAEKPTWCDCLLCDTHFGHGEWPVEEFGDNTPGALPVVGFPEISMHGMYPWGGYGANPRPGRWQQYWNRVREYLNGSLPYSEGAYEDINKTLILQFEWAPDRPADDIVREYAAFELGHDVAEDAAALCRMLEEDLDHAVVVNADGQKTGADEIIHRLARNEKAESCRDLARAIEDRMRPALRGSWRWRLLRIRAELDALLKASGGKTTDDVEVLFEELIERFSLQDATGAVLPPSRKRM